MTDYTYDEHERDCHCEDCCDWALESIEAVKERLKGTVHGAKSLSIEEARRRGVTVVVLDLTPMSVEDISGLPFREG